MASADFPAGFFERAPTPAHQPTTLDDAAVAAIRDLYSDLGVDGRVLDLGGAAQAHFEVPPDELLTFDGDLDGPLPYGDDAFDDVVLSGRVGTLVRPRETFAEAARVLRRSGRLICTFAGTVHVPGEVRGWRATDDAGRMRLVRSYFTLASAFGPAESDLRTSLSGTGDRLWAIWAAKRR
jgi:SAM-dependent methyltransferase